MKEVKVLAIHRPLAEFVPPLGNTHAVTLGLENGMAEQLSDGWEIVSHQLVVLNATVVLTFSLQREVEIPDAPPAPADRPRDTTLLEQGILAAIATLRAAGDHVDRARRATEVADALQARLTYWRGDDA